MAFSRETLYRRRQFGQEQSFTMTGGSPAWSPRQIMRTPPRERLSVCPLGKARLAISGADRSMTLRWYFPPIDGLFPAPPPPRSFRVHPDRNNYYLTDTCHTCLKCEKFHDETISQVSYATLWEISPRRFKGSAEICFREKGIAVRESTGSLFSRPLLRQR